MSNIQNSEMGEKTGEVQDEDAVRFQRYKKLKHVIILYNTIVASMAFGVCMTTIYRYSKGIYQPWLFKYAFADKDVYFAVHSIEQTYFPKGLTFTEVVYIVGPIYL